MQNPQQIKQQQLVQQQRPQQLQHLNRQQLMRNQHMGQQFIKQQQKTTNKNQQRPNSNSSYISQMSPLAADRYLFNTVHVLT